MNSGDFSTRNIADLSQTLSLGPQKALAEDSSDEDSLSENSAESFEEILSTMATSLKEQSIKERARAMVLELLKEDEVLKPLIKAALGKYKRERVIKNLGRFISGYCVLLQRLNLSNDQRKAGSFLRHGARNFAAQICEDLDPAPIELREALASEKRKSKAPERDERIARFMSDTTSITSDDEDEDLDD